MEVAQFGAMLEDLGGRPHHGMAGISKSKVGENKRSYIFSLCLDHHERNRMPFFALYKHMFAAQKSEKGLPKTCTDNVNLLC